MQMRFRVARTITITGFAPEAAPSSASEAHITLQEWVADHAGILPTSGHNLRVRFLSEAGVAVSGASAQIVVWGRSASGVWVADSGITASETGSFASVLIGDLFVQVVLVDVSSAPTAATIEILIQERAG